MSNLANTTGQPRVTIVMVPREVFSTTRRTLENLYEQTPMPFKLVCVDGGSPGRVKRYLRKQARQRGFTLIRTYHYLAQNAARNIAIRHVDTEYVVIIDNDVMVAPGWLEALLNCAESTGAAVVTPIYCWGEPLHSIVHVAGLVAGVRKEHGKRYYFDRLSHMDEPLDEVRGKLTRRPCDAAELHCILTRKSVLDSIGPLDTQLIGTRDHLDFSFRVLAMGGSIYLEPDAVVTYLRNESPVLSDLPYFLLRWSEQWNQSSLRRFCQNWDLSNDPARISDQVLKPHRQAALGRLRSTSIRLCGWRMGTRIADTIEEMFIAVGRTRFRMEPRERLFLQ